MSPLEARRANFMYEIGSFLFSQFPEMVSWKLKDPEEDPLKESYFEVEITMKDGTSKTHCVTCSCYIISFALAGESKPVSVEERVQRWLVAHTENLLTDEYTATFEELGNDASFIEQLIEEVTFKGYDAIRSREGIKFRQIK